MNENGFVDVFPISSGAFGLRDDWYAAFAPRLVEPAYLLMVLFLVISIGVMTLKRFEDVDFTRKTWNIPVIIALVAVWPFVVLGLKNLIDAFNTFLVFEIFRIPWRGFGFPDMGSLTNIMGWSAENLARLMPNLAYWLVYAFFTLFFFFFAVMGPFILAKGILYDEIEMFLDTVREIAILFLWQTTLIIIVAFILPEIVSGEPFPNHPASNFYFLSLILGIMIFFVPSITRKFGNHFGESFFPPGFKWGGAMLGLTAVGKMSSAGLATAGITFTLGPRWPHWKHRILRVEEFSERYRHDKEVRRLHDENEDLERELNDEMKRLEDLESQNLSLIELSKRAQSEIKGRTV